MLNFLLIICLDVYFTAKHASVHLNIFGKKVPQNAPQFAGADYIILQSEKTKKP